MYAARLLIAAVVSLAAHYVFASVVERLPRRDPPPRPRPLSVRLVDAPPPPPELPPAPPTAAPPEPIPEAPQVVPDPVAPPPEPAKPRPKPKPKAPPRTRPADAAPSDTAVTTVAPPPGPTTDVPVFGVTMESNSTRGPVVPRGNTLEGPARPAGEGPVRPLAGGGAPVAAHEVSKMPLPVGRCEGQSTEEARAAGTEGVVLLDLVVGADGRARDIQVVRGLPHGLNAAAIAALEACRFRPGERNGQPVPVRIRAFKVRFVLDDDR